MSEIQEKTNFTYDPYAILQVDSKATLEQVKMAYKTLARVFHPDKGGHPEMFRMINEAYQSILKRYKNRPQTLKDLEKARADLKVSQRGTLTKKSFNLDKFNAEFEQHSDPSQDYVYGVDHTGYKERNFAQYQKEREQVNRDLEKMRPIFNRGMGFNPNVFNRLFVQLKDKQKSQQPNSREIVSLLDQQFNQGGLVEAGQANTNQEHSPAFNPHQLAHVTGGQRNDSHTVAQMQHGGLIYQQYGSGNDGQGQLSFHNPGELSTDQYDQFMQQPDITQVTSMSKAEAKRRLEEYRSHTFNIERGAGPPPAIDPSTLQQDPYGTHGGGFLEYPRSSHDPDRQTENTHPSLLQSNTPQPNALLPQSQMLTYHYPDENQMAEGKPTSPRATYYDHLANIRDHFNMDQPQTPTHAQQYYYDQSYSTSQPRQPQQQSYGHQRRPEFTPEDFYQEERVYVDTQVAQEDYGDQYYYEDPTQQNNDQNQLMNDMAQELAEMKQKMALQDRLLRKMHRRNKELNASRQVGGNK